MISILASMSNVYEFKTQTNSSFNIYDPDYDNDI